MRPRLQPHASEAATRCERGCNPMRPRLQPDAAEAATLCGRGCNPLRPRLQPYVIRQVRVEPRGLGQRLIAVPVPRARLG